MKTGKYGFHTGLQANPWWQVDLDAAVPIGKIVVYNRLDYQPGLHNADTLRILTSDDGKRWTLRYDNAGKYFGGVSGAKPLEVRFKPGELSARFVRLLVPSPQPIFFHLDEVEIYAPGDSARNLALHRPADQSSLSPWSTAKVPAETVYNTAECIERGSAWRMTCAARGSRFRRSFKNWMPRRPNCGRFLRTRRRIPNGST